MTRTWIIKMSITFMICITLSANLLGVTIDPFTGEATDWGVNPFVQTGSSVGNHFSWAPSGSLMTYWFEENNYSTMDYPGRIDHQPSPGGRRGEAIDLEALYWRLNRDDLQVLLISSLGNGVYDRSWKTHYRLGDLFIDVDGGGYDYAVATSNDLAERGRPWQKYNPSNRRYTTFDHSADPGALFEIDDEDSLVGIIGPDKGGYGRNSRVSRGAFPWALDQSEAELIGQVDLTKEVFSYADRIGGGFYGNDPNSPTGIWRDEDDTWFFQWNIGLDLIDPERTLSPTNLDELGLHIAVECGNDLMDTEQWFVEPYIPPPPSGTIPEPITMATLLLGAGGLGTYFKKRRKK